MIDEVTLEMVLLQLIPFLVTVIGLHTIILKPMLSYLAERERNIEGFKNEADSLQGEVASKLAELDAKLLEARREAQDERARLRLEAKAAESEILDAARTKSDAVVAEARGVLATERDSASKQLQGTARGLSSTIASTILGRQVQGN
ncbi:MAG: ATP synthase F0 subunit B [Deltaproteobacteria bacterium]|nr:ATP synthase F0 subunit B [Deltaproteobacteria bacterium]